MTLHQSGLAATDKDFRLRVQAAIFKLAQDVMNEPDDTEGHIIREGLAKSVIQGPAAYVEQFAWLCASNGAIAASVTTEGTEVQVGAPDGDIEFVCASNWDVASGWR